MGLGESFKNLFRHEGAEGASQSGEKEKRPLSESKAEDKQNREYTVGEKVKVWSDTEGKVLDWTVAGAGKYSGWLKIRREMPDGRMGNKEITLNEIRDNSNAETETESDKDAPAASIDKESIKRPDAGREYGFGDQVRVFSKSEQKVLDWKVVKKNQGGSLVIQRTLPDGRVGTKIIMPSEIVGDEVGLEPPQAA